ncbi:MAG: hypothetical protein ACTS85_04295 [Arsenophonus sp. NC-PG7-MAG3]
MKIEVILYQDTERRFVDRVHSFDRNSYVLQQIIQAAISDVEIKVPNVNGIATTTKYASTTHYYHFIQIL